MMTSREVLVGGRVGMVPSGPTFPTSFRQPFLEDGYGSILTKKCVV